MSRHSNWTSVTRCYLRNPGGALLPWTELRHGDGIDDFVEAMMPEAVLFNDLDATTAANAVSQIGYQFYSSMRQPPTETAWKTIPSTYIVCDADNALPVAAQEPMAKRANDVYRLNTSHSLFSPNPQRSPHSYGVRSPTRNRAGLTLRR
jgi:hypothetical protein